MAVTTIKLPDELKARIARLVEKRGQSMHAFMVEAIERETALAEKRARFVADALAAREEMERTGEGFDAEAVDRHIRARLAGKKSSRPRPSPWRK